MSDTKNCHVTRKGYRHKSGLFIPIENIEKEIRDPFSLAYMADRKDMTLIDIPIVTLK